MRCVRGAIFLRIFADVFIMWIQPVDTLELVVKGIFVGAIASAPMGPVGVLIVQRTLKKGRWYGFVTGVGAAISDLVYAVITGVGMAMVLDLIERPSNLYWLKVIGGVMLFCFGVFCMLSNPTRGMRQSGINGKGTLLHNAGTGFLLTLSNPLIIFLFMAMMARLDFVVPERYWLQALAYLSIFGGALLWWLGLTAVIDKAREHFQVSTILYFNRILGLIVIIASLVAIFTTIL